MRGAAAGSRARSRAPRCGTNPSGAGKCGAVRGRPGLLPGLRLRRPAAGRVPAERGGAARAGGPRVRGSVSACVLGKAEGRSRAQKGCLCFSSCKRWFARCARKAGGPCCTAPRGSPLPLPPPPLSLFSLLSPLSPPAARSRARWRCDKRGVLRPASVTASAPALPR